MQVEHEISKPLKIPEEKELLEWLRRDLEEEILPEDSGVIVERVPVERVPPERFEEILPEDSGVIVERVSVERVPPERFEEILPEDSGAIVERVSVERVPPERFGVVVERVPPSVSREEKTQPAIQSDKAPVTEVILKERSKVLGSSRTLTRDYVENTIATYLGAIARIQHIIDEVKGRQPREIRIISAQQHSPISISIEGVAEAVGVIRDTFVPWRRKHGETLTRLLEQEKQVEIELRKAEVLEKRAAAAKGRAEADKLAAEAAKQHEEAERMKLENDKLRLELDMHNAKIQLALDMITQVAPDLSEVDKTSYVVKLLPPLSVLMSSELDISTLSETDAIP